METPASQIEKQSRDLKIQNALRGEKDLRHEVAINLSEQAKTAKAGEGKKFQGTVDATDYSHKLLLKKDHSAQQFPRNSACHAPRKGFTQQTHWPN